METITHVYGGDCNANEARLVMRLIPKKFEDNEPLLIIIIIIIIIIIEKTEACLSLRGLCIREIDVKSQIGLFC